jgi:hypothetical protein
MRDALKNVFSHQVTLEDNSQFYYTVTPYELTNALGSIIAILQEYNFTKKDDNSGQFSCKLYKTKEGNWYDIEELNSAVNNTILRALKSAITSQENCETL